MKLQFLRKKNLSKVFSFLVFVLLMNSYCWGQASIAALSTNYTTDFNLLTSGTWTDNTTVSGWYAKTDLTASIASYAANTGATTTAGLYAFGVAGTNALTDRGLGWGISNAYTGASGTGKAYVGWRLKNNTGSTITSISVTWTGEQWRKENVAAQSLSLEYQSGTTITNLTTGTWTSASSTFSSLQNNAATPAAIDGNAPANRTTSISATITVSIISGDEIMLRWSDLNDVGSDHLMSIDDVTINAAGSSCTAPTITLQPSNTTTCSNVAASLTVATSTGSPTYQWQASANGSTGWVNVIDATPSGATYTGATSATLGITSATTYYYNCIITASACSITSSNATLNVTPNAPASVSIAASPSNNICTGTSVTFTATPTNGGAGPSYQWKKNGVNIGANSTTYIDAGLINTDAITCIMTSNASCVTGSPATSNVITMTVSTPVTPSLTIAASANPICAGTNVTFTPTPTNGGTPSYQWKKNGGNVGTGATYSDAALANGDLITCVMTATGCVSPATATSNTITMTVNALPATPAAGSNSAICSSATLNLTSNATGTIAWTGPNTFTSAIQNPSIVGATTAVTGTYSVTSTVGGCTSIAGTTAVTVNSGAAITVQPSSTSTSAGANATFAVTATGAGLTYQWEESTNGGGSFSTITNGGVYSGATTATLTLTGVTLGMDTYKYRCVITGTCGNVTSDGTATLTVTTVVYAAGDYRTNPGGPNTLWSNVNNWEQYSGAVWAVPAAVPNSTTSVVYLNRSMNTECTVTSRYKVNKIYVDNGATLTIDAATGGCTFNGLEIWGADGIIQIKANSKVVCNGGLFLQDPSLTDQLVVENTGWLTINYSCSNSSLIWQGVENFKNGSTLEIVNWNWGASATNASLMNGASTQTISDNSDGWKFGNVILNTTLASIGASNWTLYGGNYTPAIANMFENDVTINNPGTGYVIGATNKTGTNGFVINGNLIVNSGNFTFGSSFSTDNFNHQITINGNFEYNGSGTLKGHFGNAIPTLLSGFVNFKGNVTVASTATFTTDKASDAAGTRLLFNFNGTATQLVDVGCVATGTNWFIKNGATVQLSNNNLTFNSVAALTSTLTVESGATLHFGWASNGTTPLYFTQSGALTGTVAFASNSGSTLKITSADGIVKNIANLGNVQIPVIQKTFNQDATFWYVGKANQNVGDAVESAGIRNLTIETNPSSLVVTMNVNDIIVNSFFTLSSGVLATGSYLITTFSAAASNLIHTVGNASFVYGNLRRYITTNTNTYEFPLGDGVVTTNYKRLDLLNNSLATTTYITGSVANVAQGTPAADVDANLGALAVQGSTQLTVLLNTAIWTLIPDAQPTGGTSYGVNLYVENVSNLSGTDDDKFCPVKRTDASVTYADWSTWSSTPTAIPTAGVAGRIYNGGTGYAQRTGYQQFSRHAIAKAPVVIVLPIELLSFTANYNGKNVDLKWATASELNNDYFTIERSADAVNFEQINSIDGAGNSTQTLFYSTVDDAPLNGISYYRLKQTDFDGNYSYSNIASVNIENNNSFQILNAFNSIENNILNVTVNCGNNCFLNFELYDMTGKKVFSSNENISGSNRNISIPTNNLSNGIYLLKVYNGEKMISKKLKL